MQRRKLCGVAVIGLLVVVAMGVQGARPDEVDTKYVDSDQGADLAAVAVPDPSEQPVSTQVRLEVSGPDFYHFATPLDYLLFVDNEGAFDLNLAAQGWEAVVYKLNHRPFDQTAAIQQVVDKVDSGFANPLDVETYEPLFDAQMAWSSITNLDREGDWWVPTGATCPLAEKEAYWQFHDPQNVYFGDGLYVYAAELLNLGQQVQGAVVGLKFFTVSSASPTREVSPLQASPTCSTGSFGPGPQIVTGSTQEGYVAAGRGRWRMAGGEPIRWFYHTNDEPTDATHMPAGSAEAALRAASNRWDLVAGSTADLTFGGLTSGGYWDQYDLASFVGWSDDLASGTRARVNCHRDAGGYLVDCDMKFNRNLSWSAGATPTPGRFFLEDVATHEFGHIVGLGDMTKDAYKNCETNTVWHTMCQGAPAGSSIRTTLEWGDLAGLRYLYPKRPIAVSPWDTGTRNGVGSITSGTDAAAAFFDAGTQPDLIIAWIDAPTGSNVIHYRVGMNLDGAGGGGSWQPIRTAVDDSKGGDRVGVGHDSQGLAVDIHKIGMGTAPDLFIAWVDDRSGENEIFYIIGWDLTATGDPTSWSTIRHASVTWPVGSATGDIDACVHDIDSSGTMDVVLAWMDGLSGENAGRYVVGKSMSASTGMPSSWTVRTITDVSGNGLWEGDYTDGVGFDCVSFEGPGLDYVFAWVDGRDGDDRIHYRVGAQVSSTGVPAAWERRTAIHGPGNHLARMGSGGTSGLGIATADIDRLEADEMIFVWTDNPSGENTIYYWIEWNGKYKSHD